MNRIAILASGSGSNAENIVNYFYNNFKNVKFRFFTNKKDAFVIKRAKKLGVKITVFSRSDFYDTDKVLNMLKEEGVDLIVLAGFLWLVPEKIINSFPNKIINIHPALLPKFGGKGMYGSNVHKAVYEAKEKETGITIHYVNEKYDDGDIIFQKKFDIPQEADVEYIENKIHELEYKYFPEVIAEIIK